jgi:hypothetical protein
MNGAPSNVPPVQQINNFMDDQKAPAAPFIMKEQKQQAANKPTSLAAWFSAGST